MALIYKVLGQTITGGSFIGNVLYTVPIGGTAVSSTLSICNLNSSNCTYSIDIVPSGQTLSAKHSIASNTEIKSKETIALSIGITLGSNDSIIVNSSNSNLSFNLFGAQNSGDSSLQIYDGSSLTGWTQADGTVTIDSTIGYPSPSWKVTSRGFFKDLGVNLLNKTFTFDMKLASGADGGIVFCNAAGGSGSYRAAIRAFQPGTTANGIRLGSNGGWQYIGQTVGVVASYFPNANTWYTVKLQISSSGVCTWFINGIKQATTVTIPSGYTSTNTTDNYFGFVSNGGGNQNYDNFVVYDGIV